MAKKSTGLGARVAALEDMIMGMFSTKSAPKKAVKKSTRRAAPAKKSAAKKAKRKKSKN